MRLHRKKIIIILIVVVIALCSGYFYYFNNFYSLEKSIKRNYTNVIIHKIDNDKKLILFSEGTNTKRQYILSEFYNLGNFFYNIYDDNTGIIFNMPYIIMVSYKKSVGNVIWGVFNNDTHARKVEIRYMNKIDKSEYSFNATIERNIFMGFPNTNYKFVNFFDGNWTYSLKVFDDKGVLIVDKNNLTVLGHAKPKY